MAEFYGEAGFPLPVGAATQSFARLLGDSRLGAIWLVEEDETAVR